MSLFIILIISISFLFIMDHFLAPKFKKNDNDKKIETKLDEEYWKTHDKNEPHDE